MLALRCSACALDWTTQGDLPVFLAWVKPDPRLETATPSTRSLNARLPEGNRLETKPLQQARQGGSRIGGGGLQDPAIERGLAQLPLRFAPDIRLQFGSGLLNNPVSRV